MRVHLFDHYLYRICDACAVILISLYYLHTLDECERVCACMLFAVALNHNGIRIVNKAHKECETQWLSVAHRANQWHIHASCFFYFICVLFFFCFVHNFVANFPPILLLLLLYSMKYFNENKIDSYCMLFFGVRDALISHFHLNYITFTFTKCSTWNQDLNGETLEPRFHHKALVFTYAFVLFFFFE